MPALPEVAHAARQVRVVEVQHQANTHHPGNAPGHVGVTAEVEVNLPGKKKCRQDQGRGVEVAGRSVDPGDIQRQVIRQGDLLEITHDEDREAVGEVPQSHGNARPQLRQEIARPLDRPRQQPREERDKGRMGQETLLPRYRAAMDIDDIANGLQ